MKKWTKNEFALFLFFLILIIAGAAAIVIFSQQRPTIEKTATFDLEILEIPDFELTLDAALIKATAGSVAGMTGTITPNSSFAGVVVLTIENLPAGVTATFFPSSTITVGGAPAGFQIDISIPADNALVGIHPITIRAKSDNYN